MFEITAGEYTLAEPLWLLLLVILPIIAWLRGRRAVSAIILPFSGAWRRSAFSGSSRIATILAFAGIAVVIFAMARPQLIEAESHTKSKGYDIILCLDLSGSMLAEDYTAALTRNKRLAAVNPVVTAFREKRSNDRIGLVAFAGRAYTVAPLTFDHEWLSRQTDRLKTGLIEEEGTAIGDALGVAISRLQEGAKEMAGEREGAFIILLTDGENNGGSIDPNVAAELAADSGIRVFTIGAGREGPVNFPVFNEEGERIGTDRMISRFDERGLRVIADKTNGQYFRAESSSTIEDAFDAIDQQSKIEFEVNEFTYTTELFPYFGIAGGCIVFMGSLLTGRAGKEALS
ncbi:MAG: VWA domain-containing protein [Verrucomicrobiota bacterium]